MPLPRCRAARPSRYRTLPPGITRAAGTGRLLVDDVAIGVEVSDERLDAALEVERVRVGVALVAELDRDALVEKGVTAQGRADRLPRELDLLKDLGVRPESDVGAPAIRLPDDRHRTVGHAPGVLLVVGLAIEIHLDHQTLTERVDDRKADTVQSARDLVTAAAELAACVECGQHHLERGFLRSRVHPHRDA